MYFNIVIFLFSIALVAQSNGIDSDSISVLLKSALENYELGKNDKSIEEFEIVLKYGKRNQDSLKMLVALQGISSIYQRLGDLERAYEYTDRLLKISPLGVTVIDYNNIGVMHLSKRDTISAIKYYEMSRNLCIETNKMSAILFPCLNLAEIKHLQGKYDESSFYFKEVLKYYVPNGKGNHPARAYTSATISLAEIEVKNKRYDNAMPYLRKADSAALIAKNYDALFRSEKTRYIVYDETNQFEKITESLEKQIEYLSISKEKQEEKLVENNKLERKLLDKEKTLEYTTKLNESQKETLRKTRLFVYVVLFFLGFTSIILYLLLRSNRTRKKLNDDLRTKNIELYDAKEKTEYASRLKENFFSTISHELRTPLYAVTGITDVLIDDEPKKEHVHYLKTLKSSGEHLLGLINNILQINKFNTNGIEVNSIGFDIRNLINNIKDSLSYLRSENNNKIYIDIDKTVPVLLEGDSLKIAQVLVNLLSNALKFTEEGDVWVIVKCVEKTVDFVTLNIRVNDNGIGISKDKQVQVFEDFYQESMRFNRNYEGTGLGLAIVKRLLGAMGSEIKVTSNIGEGATFYFDLKLKVKDEVSCIAPKVKEVVNLEGKHFLVVDDNVINLKITRRILESKNAKVTVVENGFEGIEKVKENTFNVILMDIHMPNMNGYKTTQKIRVFNKRVPIIALTAVSLEDNKDKIINSGMNGVIVKPFEIESFFNEIKRFF